MTTNGQATMNPDTPKRDQAGVTMIELLAVIAIGAVIAGGVGAWMVGTLRAQDVVRDQVSAARVVSLVNASFVSDVAGAQFAVGSDDGSGSQRSATDFRDCPDAAEGAVANATHPATAVLVLISPGDRRIVYTIADNPSGNGKSLYRRECANTRQELGMPSLDPGDLFADTTDPSLTDPVEKFLNEPEQPTTGTTTSKITSSIENADISAASSTCPPRGSSSDYDVNCQTVKLSVTLEGRSEPLVFEATRRTDSYCAPECLPEAAFSVSTVKPAKGDLVTLDARSSVDRRGDYYPVGQNESYYASHADERLHYFWTVTGDTAACDTTGAVEWGANAYAGTAWPDTAPPTPLTATGQVVGATGNGSVSPSITFHKACKYNIALVVTNASGRTSEVYSRTVEVRGTRPDARILNSPQPIRIVRNQVVNFTSVIQTFEGQLNNARSNWSFGDGSSEALIPASSNASPFSCPVDVPNCTASNNAVSHRYTEAGTYVAVLTVTDSTGLASTFMVQVDVESEYFYVSAASGSDTADCGPIVPDYKPCATIGQGVQRAAANTEGKTDVLVARGAYPSFTAAPGIDVWGGRDDTGGQSASWAYVPSQPSRVAGTESAESLDRRAVTIDGVGVPTKLSDLVIETGNTTNLLKPVHGIVINDSSDITLSNVKVVNGTGRNPTGVLITGGSDVTVRDSDINSGTPLQVQAADPANRSAYGIRALGGSDVRVLGGKVTSETGLTGIAGTKGADVLSAERGCTGVDGQDHTTAMGGACTATVIGTSNGSSGGGGGNGGNFTNRGGPGSNGATARGGAGGAGGYTVTPRPEAGDPGSGGDGGGRNGNGVGVAGAAGSSVADSAGDLWDGPIGGTGAAATAPGSPGGGGGGGGGTYVFLDGSYEGQQGGGGGGGGKPAASGGTGGFVGGGSFGVYANGSTVTVGSGARVTAGAGGAGGTGGQGGKGGTGGNGGVGAAADRAGDASSGGGGGGGAGAGGGGGGAGGPSVAVFSVGEASVPNVSGAVLAGTPGGVGGVGGPGGIGGEPGAPGGDPGSDPGLGAAYRGAPGIARGSQPCDNYPNNPGCGAWGQAGTQGEPGMVCPLYAGAAASAGCYSSSVESIVRTGASLTNGGYTAGHSGSGGTLTWLVTFKDSVDGVGPQHFTTTGEGIENLGSLAVRVTVTGAGTTRIVEVSGIKATSPDYAGKIRLVMTGVDGITAGGQQIAGPRPTPFTGQTYDIDQKAPTVSEIKRSIPTSVTNADAVAWMVSFSETVQGPDTGGGQRPIPGEIFTFTRSGVTDPYVSGTPTLVAGTTATWEVTVNSGTGDGMLALDLSTNANGTVTDRAGNPLEIPDGGYPGPSYTIDQTPPKVLSILREDPTAAHTKVPTVKWKVTFSEPVVGLAATGVNNNFSLNPTFADAAITGADAWAATGDPDGSTYTVSATTGTLEGDLLLNLSNIGLIKDPAGNPLDPDPDNNGVDEFAGPPAVDGTHEQYIVDRTRPTVTITRSDPATEATNSSGTVKFLVKFDEAVTGVDGSDFALVETLSGAPSIGTVTPQGTAGSDYLVDVGLSSTSGSGTVQLNLTSAGAASVADLAGNLAFATDGEAYIVDRVNPTVSATKTPPSEWWKLASAPVTVAFASSDPVDNGVASGAAAVHYTTSAGAGSTPADPRDIANPSTGPNGSFGINAAGVTRISYSALDGAGNWSAPQSIEVKLDGLAPETDLTISGAAGSDPATNNYVGFAKLQFDATDPVGVPAQQSGVATTWYTLDGSDPTDSGNVNRRAYDAALPQVIRKDMPAGTIKFSTVDNAGNYELPVKSVSFTITTHGPVFSGGLNVATCSTTSQGHMASGAVVGDYVDAGCIELSANVTPYDPLLGVSKVDYFRCDGRVDPCVLPADGGTAVLIGTTTGPTPYQVPSWWLSGTAWFVGLQRDYTVVAVAYDVDGTTSSSAVRTFGVDVSPPVASAPTVDEKS